VFTIGSALGLGAGSIAALALSSTLGFFAVAITPVGRDADGVDVWALYGLIVARRAGFTPSRSRASTRASPPPS